MSIQPQPKKVVYFVRHGQSVDNAAPVFQSIHSPLSPKGNVQARQIAERLSALSFEALIASPVARTKQTAEAIANTTGQPIEFSDLFVERVKPSAIDGKLWADVEALRMYKTWEESLYVSGKRVADGENYDDIVRRADAALEYLRTRSEATMVVVAHGHFLRTIISRVLLGNNLTGDILKKIQMVASLENTALTVLRYADTWEEAYCWRLWTYNDYSHFADLLSTSTR